MANYIAPQGKNFRHILRKQWLYKLNDLIYWSHTKCGSSFVRLNLLFANSGEAQVP